MFKAKYIDFSLFSFVVFIGDISRKLLRGISSMKNVQIIVLFVLASLSVTNCAMPAMPEVVDHDFFARCDHNNDKVLTADEVTFCMRKYHDFATLNTLFESDGSKFLAMIDLNHDGFVSDAEYKMFNKR